MFLAYTWLVEMCHMVSYLLPFSHSVAKWFTISCNIVCNKSIRGKKGTKRVTYSVLMKSYIIATLQYFCTLSMVSAFFSRCCFVMFKIFCKQLCCQENIVIISESAKKTKRTVGGRYILMQFVEFWYSKVKIDFPV